ncbi:MAG: septum formation initiator family protein [Patescibacteria group bacterium]
MPVKNRSFFIQIISSKLFIITGFAVLVFMGVSLSKEVVRRVEISTQVSSLENEISSLEKKNSDLSELIAYFKSESYREREARLKLGLEKEGEQMIILPKDYLINSAQGVNSGTEGSDLINEAPASQKWWNYFFK